jgi:outer membrane protein OmpA-like peptidoglycan-associated protein
MRWQNRVLGVAAILGMAFLAGCASNDAKQANEGVKNEETKAAAQPASSVGDARNAQSRQAALAQVAAVPNPFTVSFDKMAVALDDKSKQTMPQLAERAKSAKKITITGFCDAREIGNPGDAAVARAIAIRDELVARGIATANIQVRFNTKVAKKHAAEVRFD